MRYLLICLCLSIQLFACTGLKLVAKDGSIVHGRTAEFGVDLEMSLLYIPRQYSFVGVTPMGAGLNYKSKYAAVGVIAYNEPAIMDGMNEKGLSVGIFYFPHYAEYTEVTSKNQIRALSPLDFSNWILTQFATVEEVKRALDTVVIVPTIYEKWGATTPPFHYIVIDRSGKSIVIEPMEGELVVYDNPLGIITNSPTFDWHMTNLNNYINLSPFNAEPVIAQGVEFIPFGQGSGMVGLPGDFSPPARFVRAALFSLTALPSPNSAQAVLQAFHILNQFDIPVGIVREKVDGIVYTDKTLATAVRDPQTLRYYVKTYDNQTIKMVDLKSFDPLMKETRRLPLAGSQPIKNISDEFIR